MNDPADDLLYQLMLGKLRNAPTTRPAISGWNNKTPNLEEIAAIMESIPGALPPHRRRDEFGQWPFERAERNCILVHPNDTHCFPAEFKSLCTKVGIEIVTSAFMLEGRLLVMGQVAEIWHRQRLHEQVAEAMKENARFLALMKNSGLL
jgi:hypothetical protein